MRILVINGHPNKESYCQAFFKTIVENIDTTLFILSVKVVCLVSRKAGLIVSSYLELSTLLMIRGFSFGII
ncbi:hypothetical protein D8881_01845 [Streptococcus sanguinis]|uniref:Flavodoxin-like fold domain-containing protein n=1 Tax=Streptococcus sanguinis TaxID=1305 RepID=A0ABD7JQJ8_STRSA|nr:hypothetical protein D8881_01845 [Streptococcus sanguinis]RSI36971.1 hypothetical protein D8875_09805 [Streptococcus sanguinis]